MFSNLTPVKKVVLALAAMCIVVSVITANNLASVMMLVAARNNNQNANQSAYSQQAPVQNNQGSNQSSNNNNNNNAGSNNTAVNNSTSSDNNAAANNNASSNTSTDTNKPADDANKPADNATQSGEKTTAEIVDVFNKAVNSVKTDAKSVKQLNVTNYLAGKATITSGISFIYNNVLGGDEWLDGMLKDNSQGEATYEGADIKAKFPVENEDWSSKLTADDVASVNCVEGNGVYTITITTKADAKSDSVKRGEGHAPKAFNVVLPSTVNDNIPGAAASLVGTAAMDYPESTVVATVDVETGKLIKAEYDTKWTINFDKMGIILPLGTKAAYEINY